MGLFCILQTALILIFIFSSDNKVTPVPGPKDTGKNSGHGIIIAYMHHFHETLQRTEWLQSMEVTVTFET